QESRTRRRIVALHRLMGASAACGSSANDSRRRRRGTAVSLLPGRGFLLSVVLLKFTPSVLLGVLVVVECLAAGVGIILRTCGTQKRFPADHTHLVYKRIFPRKAHRHFLHGGSLLSCHDYLRDERITGAFYFQDKIQLY